MKDKTWEEGAGFTAKIPPIEATNNSGVPARIAFGR